MGGRFREERSNGSGWVGPVDVFKPHGLQREKRREKKVNLHLKNVPRDLMFECDYM